MKLKRLSKNPDFAGVMFGAFLAGNAWLSTTILRNDGLAGAELIATISIAGMLGFGLSKVSSYNYAMPDLAQDRIVSRQLGFYLGVYFALFLTLVLRPESDWPFYLAQVSLSGAIFGVPMYLLQAKKRRNLPKPIGAYDFGNPVNLGSSDWKKIKSFPFLIAFLLVTFSIGFDDIQITSFVCACSLAGIPTVYPAHDSGIWKRLSWVFFAVCFWAALYSLIQR